MKRRFAIVAVVLCASAAEGQIIRRPSRSLEPPKWLGFSIGLVQAGSVTDGTTNSTWDFGSATQYRVSLEKSLQSGSSFGIVGGYASVPLTYTGGADNATTMTVACAFGCDARANVIQLAALFHAGSGMGFHQVIELTGGATAYSNFHTQTDNAKLAPAVTDYDMAFSLGYGFGYGLSPSSALEVVQELGVTIHQKTGLAASDNNTPRSSTTRISLRFGFGGR